MNEIEEIMKKALIVVEKEEPIYIGLDQRLALIMDEKFKAYDMEA